MFTTTTVYIGRNDLEIKLGVDFDVTPGERRTYDSPGCAGDLDITDLDIISVKPYGRSEYTPTEATQARLLRCLKATDLESIEEDCWDSYGDSRDDEPDYEREPYFDRMRRTL